MLFIGIGPGSAGQKDKETTIAKRLEEMAGALEGRGETNSRGLVVANRMTTARQNGMPPKADSLVTVLSQVS